MNAEAQAFLRHVAPLVDRTLDRLLPSPDTAPERLHEAMRYSALSTGKRIRPALAIAACRAFAGDEEESLAPAAALEMIHAYSLIHDDLPAMDDDDLRRGRPTSHVVYGDALAILAGDALHTRACEVLASWPEGDDWAVVRSRIQRHVLGAIGSLGMVGGQALDMEMTGRGGSVAEADLEGIHRRKTGALIRASMVTGAEVARAGTEAVEAMSNFGALAGLAFQVVDDILDVTADPSSLGKTKGKDAAAKKATYPAVLGLPGARRCAEELTSQALRVLSGMRFPRGGDPAPLLAITRFLLERTS